MNTTSEQDQAEVILTSKSKILFSAKIDIDPANPYTSEIEIPEAISDSELTIILKNSSEEELISYTPVDLKAKEMPEVAVPPAPPEDIKSVEELYMAGLRLEQFYNPSFDPEPYYTEALRRDPDNYRVNTALGLMKLRNGNFKMAEENLQGAVDRITSNHTKPKDGEAYY